MERCPRNRRRGLATSSPLTPKPISLEMETETGYDKKGTTQTKSFAVFRFLVKTFNIFFALVVLKLFHFKTTENAAIVQYLMVGCCCLKRAIFNLFNIYKTNPDVRRCPRKLQ
jgi:hypothetical protein